MDDIRTVELLRHAGDGLPEPAAPVARVVAMGRGRARRARIAQAVLAGTAALAVAGIAAAAASVIGPDGDRPSPVVFAAAAEPEGGTLPADSVSGTKRPAPGTPVTLITRVPVDDGTDLAYAYWRSADGWDCVGWQGYQMGTTGLCVNDATTADPNELQFAGDALQRADDPAPLGQVVSGFAPADATTIRIRAEDGRVTTARTFSGVPAARGGTTFALIAPADLGDSRVEALNDDGRVLAARDRPAPPTR